MDPTKNALELNQLPVAAGGAPTANVTVNNTTNNSSSTTLDMRGTEGVNVAAAEADFIELQRQLTKASRVERHDALEASFGRDKTVDLESHVSEVNSTTEFNLEQVIRGQQDSADEAGIKRKHIGVIWENLSVRGVGGTKHFVKTFPSAFTGLVTTIPMYLASFLPSQRPREVEILHNFHGVLKPGEMVLVLGRPGSGCTTFLKVVTNQRIGYTAIEGDVAYAGLTAEEFAEHYRGEAVYNMEDDIHHPTLSVSQTLDFALETKLPNKRVANQPKESFKESVTSLLLKMFNIEHTRHTMVGNAFVRGVSGGERKRVSIAEMMVTNASVLAWDNTTRGLDASTALDYAKSLRILTDIKQTSTFVSLYQASAAIADQFDKVMVLDAGRTVYYGPVSEARAYMENLGFKPKPRMTLPDYLTGCTDEYEREIQEGYENVCPQTSEDLEQAWLNSPQFARLQKEMADYKAEIARDSKPVEEFRMAVREDKWRGTPKKSVYTVPFWTQVWALTKRQMILKWQDKFSLVVSTISVLLVAIMIGTVFLDLPKTSAGAFTRGGVLFMALLFNALQAFTELPATVLGRPIVNKHKAYAFHRPATLWLGQIIVDLPFSAFKIFLFSVIVYFMADLARDAGAFFTFFLIIFTTNILMGVLFRVIGVMSGNFDFSLKFAALIITMFVLDCGYLLSKPDMRPWMSWFYWINPIAYGFEALVANEFGRVNFTCTDSNLVPSGRMYTNIANQVCTLAGAVTGTNLVIGSEYIKLTYNYVVSHLWRNFGIIVGFTAFFLFCNAWFGEIFTFGAGGKTVTLYQKENAERKRLNQALEAKRNARREGKEDDSQLEIKSKQVLTWEALNYDVPVPGGEKRLLNDIYGYVEPGKLTALMGSSGAGKTTLLDVLANRKNIGVITGDVLIDAKPRGIDFQRGTAYCEQLDVHESTQTVREALRFSAYLRQPFEVPIAEKDAYVEEVIALLEMENIADAIIGTPETGLSVEERKRVTIGVELAAKPKLLLFLDEPTSGLDSQSAFNIVRFLKKLAAAGQAILCTIHQPNAALFENFDRLLLLQRGGQVVYFGEIGSDAHVMLDYFRRNGADCPPDANPAEYMLDAVGAGSAPRIGPKDWSDVWKDSPELAQIKADILRLKDERSRAGDAGEADTAEFATPLAYQLKLVIKRTSLTFWRSPDYGFTRLFNHVLVAFLTGVAYWQVNNSISAMQQRVFAIFQATVLPALILSQVEPRYDISRMIFNRESSSKMYSQFAFASSMVIAEIPYSIICAVAYFIAFYYPAGFNYNSDRAGYQFFIILIDEFFSVTLGQAIAAVTPNAFIAALLNPLLLVIFATFCGVTIPQPNLPHFYKEFVYNIDPFTRLIGGMLVTELHDLPVRCSDVELARFLAPAGQTCLEYANTFMESASGYLVNPNAASPSYCEYCPYSVGDDYLATLNLDYSHRWRDLGIFICFIVSNLAILFWGSRYLNFARR
ncbi:ATP-binding cassette transporter snq2 [Saitoella coloradoensis]